jgi:predicted lysophospholipase L1 biosynthesis ABC-type transport system permease subunit
VTANARTTVRLAWRDLKNSGARAWFIVAALAISTASISGVHGAAEVARKALQADSRAWLAGDLCIDTREPISQRAADTLDRAKMRGIDWTLMTTSLTMAASSESADPALIQVKVIDPLVYPFYGALTFEPSQSLSQALSANGAAVSEEVLQRFEVHLGDTITVSGRPFRISAVIQGEPDRFSNEVGVGLRCLVSRDSWTRSGLANSPNSVKNRVLLRLSAGSNPAVARRMLQELFPEGNLRDSQGSHRHEGQLVETVIAFLSVTAFLALLLGALGAAIALRQHAEHSLPTFAIMKMLGARSPQLGAIFAMQVVVMMTAAIAIGIPLGFALRVSILSLAGRYLVLPPLTGMSGVAIFETSAAALVALAPVLIQPVSLIRHVRPAIVLRRAMAGALTGTSKGPAALRLASTWTAVLLSSAAVAWMGQVMLGSWRSALILAAAIVATMGVAVVLATAAVSLLRARRVIRLPYVLRCGIANLTGPGNRSRTLIAALAVSLIVMIATFEGRGAVVQAVLDIIPQDQTSLYIAGFKNSAATGDVSAFVRNLNGVQNVDVMTQVRVQLHSLGRPLDQAIRHRTRRSQPPPESNLIQSSAVRADGICDPSYTLHTWDGVEIRCISADAARQIAKIHESSGDLRSKLLQASDGLNFLTADQWNFYYAELGGPPSQFDLFPPAKRAQTMTVDYYLEVRASMEFNSQRSVLAVCGAPPGTAIVAPEMATQIGTKAGSQLIFDASDQTISAIVSAIAELSPQERLVSSLKVDCSALDENSLLNQASVRIQPDRIPSVLRAIREQYPSLAIITSKEITQTVTSLTKDAMSLARLVAWFAIGGGICVLLSAVAASRGARLSEIAILSALGARRATIFKIYSIEFALIGLMSALIAGLIAWGFTSAVLAVVFHRGAVGIQWQALVMTIAISAVTVFAGGWLPILRLLFRKPLEALRSE